MCLYYQIPGGTIEESEVLDGVMINKDVTHPRMRRRIVNPRIVLLDCNLEYKKGESQVRWVWFCGWMGVVLLISIVCDAVGLFFRQVLRYLEIWISIVFFNLRKSIWRKSVPKLLP